MVGNGSKSFTSRSLDSDLIPRGPEQEMDVRLALRHAREEARGRLCSDSIRRESIASAQMEAVQSVWRPDTLADAQPLRWRAEAMDAPWASSDANMARRARRARQRARDAAAALAAQVGDLQPRRRQFLLQSSSAFATATTKIVVAITAKLL